MSVIGEIQETLTRYARDRQNMDLSGVGHYHAIYTELCNKDDEGYEECIGYDPLDSLVSELQNGISEASRFRLHINRREHTPNENGYCENCGWDLNA